MCKFTSAAVRVFAEVSIYPSTKTIPGLFQHATVCMCLKKALSLYVHAPMYLWAEGAIAVF